MATRWRELLEMHCVFSSTNVPWNAILHTARGFISCLLKCPCNFWVVLLKHSLMRILMGANSSVSREYTLLRLVLRHWKNLCSSFLFQTKTFEHFWLLSSGSWGIISSVYSSLNEGGLFRSQSYISKWERDSLVTIDHSRGLEQGLVIRNQMLIQHVNHGSSL